MHLCDIFCSTLDHSIIGCPLQDIFLPTQVHVSNRTIVTDCFAVNDQPGNLLTTLTSENEPNTNSATSLLSLPPPPQPAVVTPTSATAMDMDHVMNPVSTVADITPMEIKEEQDTLEVWNICYIPDQGYIRKYGAAICWWVDYELNKQMAALCSLPYCRQNMMIDGEFSWIMRNFLFSSIYWKL